MRQILFALSMLASCSSNSDTNDNGSDPDAGGGGGGSGTGSDSGSGVDAEVERDYNDVASLVASNLIAGDLGPMIDSIDMSYGRMPAGFTVADRTDFISVTGVRGGLTIGYKLHCLDEADEMASCDGTENHAHVKVTYKGTIGGTAEMDGVERRASWTVRELSTDTPRLGGDGSNAFSGHLTTGDYTLVVSDQLDQLLFASTPGLPLGGHIALVIKVDRIRASAVPSARTFAVVAEITFVDTATITLDGIRTYNVDLASGSVVKAN